MGDKTGIPYADATWNPMVGCSAISAGCRNCYAARLASTRLAKSPAYEGLAQDNKWTGEVRLLEDKLVIPGRWTRPRVIFACNMGDLFHDGVPFEFVAKVYAAMQLAQHHTFLVCTKRPGRRLRFYRWLKSEEGKAAWLKAVVSHPDGGRESWSTAWPFKNVWEGTTIEDQPAAEARMPDVVVTPAARRWLSFEPLVGPVDVRRWLEAKGATNEAEVATVAPAVHWGVMGGESGTKARQCDLDWMASLAIQFRESGVPMYFKQLGSRPVAGGAAYESHDPPRGLDVREEPARREA